MGRKRNRRKTGQPPEKLSRETWQDRLRVIAGRKQPRVQPFLTDEALSECLRGLMNGGLRGERLKRALGEAGYQVPLRTVQRWTALIVGPRQGRGRPRMNAGRHEWSADRVAEMERKRPEPATGDVRKRGADNDG